jgi:hypothetical protein
MSTETPDLSDVPTDDLAGLLLACAMSNDPSDRAFAKACRDEIARRKPSREKEQGDHA